MKFHININLILDIVITKKQKLEQYNIIKMFQHHNKAPRPTYTGTIAIRYTVGRASKTFENSKRTVQIAYKSMTPAASTYTMAIVQ